MGRLSLFFGLNFLHLLVKKVANQKKYLLVIYSMRVTDHHFYADQQNQLHIGGRLVDDWLQKYLLVTDLPVDNLLTENL